MLSCDKFLCPRFRRSYIGRQRTSIYLLTESDSERKGVRMEPSLNLTSGIGVTDYKCARHGKTPFSMCFGSSETCSPTGQITILAILRFARLYHHS